MYCKAVNGVCVCRYYEMTFKKGCECDEWEEGYEKKDF